MNKLTFAVLAILIVAVLYSLEEARADGYDEYCLGFYHGYEEGYCGTRVDCMAPQTYCPPPLPGYELTYYDGFSVGVLRGWEDGQN